MKTTEKKFVLASRMLLIMRESRYPKTAAELAARLDISKKSVHRYAEDLERAGHPVVFDVRGQTHYYSLLKDEDAPEKSLRLDLGAEEAMALHMARALMESAWVTPFPHALDTLQAKLAEAMPPRLRGMAAALSGAVIAHRRRGKNYRAHSRNLEKLMEAVLSRREVDIRYRAFSRGKTADYRLRPLALVPHDGGLYLLAGHPRHEKPALYAVERMEKVTGTKQGFRPPRLNLKEYLALPFGLTVEEPMDVRLRFGAAQERYLTEREWHASQKLSRQPDGSTVMTFRASGFWEIKAWVLSWGAGVEVLAPEKLRLAIAAESRKMADRNP